MGLFDSITNALGITGGGSDVPDPKIVNYTPEQEARLHNVATDSQKSAADIANSSLQGVDASGGWTSGGMLQGNQANAGANAAIQSKYQSLAGRDIGMMKQQYQQQAELTQANRLQQGFALLSAKQQMDIKNRERLMNAQLARDQARAHAIGSLFGGLGAIGGAAIGMAASGGNPMGAMIGMQAGSKLGTGLSGGTAEA